LIAKGVYRKKKYINLKKIQQRQIDCFKQLICISKAAQVVLSCHLTHFNYGAQKRKKQRYKLQNTWEINLKKKKPVETFKAWAQYNIEKRFIKFAHSKST